MFTVCDIITHSPTFRRRLNHYMLCLICAKAERFWLVSLKIWRETFQQGITRQQSFMTLRKEPVCALKINMRSLKTKGLEDSSRIEIVVFALYIPWYLGIIDSHTHSQPHVRINYTYLGIIDSHTHSQPHVRINYTHIRFPLPYTRCLSTPFVL